MGGGKAAVILMVACLLAPWSAAKANVLTGMPSAGAGEGSGGASGDPVDAVPAQGDTSPGDLIIGANPLGTVPHYVWWYGCSPTSGGMMVAHWDSQALTSNLCGFDASYWWGNNPSNPQGPARMVASLGHISGTIHPDDCLADFMNTVGGGTLLGDMAPGLTAYFAWDDPTTLNNESSDLVAVGSLVEYYGGQFTYDVYKKEIDAGHPVLLNLHCYTSGPSTPSPVFHGHSVVGYGYQDNMFTICNPYTGVNVTVPGFAVRDTWTPGSIAQASWVVESGGGLYLVSPVIDTGGVEWWPFVDTTLTQGWFWWVGSYENPVVWDWQIDHAVMVMLEPGTMLLLASGLGLLVVRRRRK